MGRISKILREADNGNGGKTLLFYCAGCGMAHQVWVGAGQGPRWGWNGDAERPTFTPSVLVRWRQYEPPALTQEIRGQIRRGEIMQKPVEKVCHSFITDGRIQYLSDSTHHLASQTIELPPFCWGKDDPDDELKDEG